MFIFGVVVGKKLHVRTLELHHHVSQKHANNSSDWFAFFQVRNLCYMVTRRERIKHSLCNLQEKIFALQIQLLEKDLDGGMETLHNYLSCFSFDVLICRFRLIAKAGNATKVRRI